MSRLSTFAVTEHGGLNNVYNMVRYAQNKTQCRKIIFQKYFQSDKGLINSTINNVNCNGSLL